MARPPAGADTQNRRFHAIGRLPATDALVNPKLHLSRRSVLAGMAGFAMLGGRPARALPATDVTFLFINDVHACRTRDGLSPNCEEEGKTDENLLRHIRALNRIEEAIWPAEIDGAATALRSAGEKVATPRGIVLGGDMTDDGGGQRAEPEEGYQLLQFSQRYQRGRRRRRGAFPGLCRSRQSRSRPGWAEGRDRLVPPRAARLCRAQPPSRPVLQADRAGRQLRCRVRLLFLELGRAASRRNCTASAAIPTRERSSSLDWLAQDLSQHAADGRPVILFQHYGWDTFSMERWDPATVTFDDEGIRPAALVERGAARSAARHGQALQRRGHFPRPRARRADDL